MSLHLSALPFAWRKFTAATVLAAVLGTGVGCAHLDVTHLQSAAAKPNNIWVFFTVEAGEEPVAGLDAKDFEIYEDGNLVSVYESQQTIQNPDVAAVMYTALLVDVSGSVMQSGQVETLITTALQFAERVGKEQRVGVFAFDGGEKIHTVVGFTDRPAGVERAVESLRRRKVQDPSTNLHGAVVQGLETLDKALSSDPRPLKFGSLVIFSDGTDHAGRVTREEMNEQLALPKYAHIERFAIGVGGELEESALADVGVDGTQLISTTDDSKDGVKNAFEKVAEKIEAHSHRYYLLSYCTPARKGEHQVRIVVRPQDDKHRGKGELEYSFAADAFGPPPTCDANRPPTFRLDKNLATPVAETSEKN